MIEDAIELALTATDFRARVGCVVTDRRGRIISTGFNKKKTHPLQYRHALRVNEEAIYLHAEIAALVACREQPHTLYVGRVLRDGSVASARPCPICMSALLEAGVSVVHYTTEDGSVETMELT